MSDTAPAAPLFRADLTGDELLLLDSRCSPKVQADVDLLKHARRIASRHQISEAAGLFVARAVHVADTKGRLTCINVAMRHCQVTGKRAALTTPRRKSRDNPYKMPVEVPFHGYDFDRGFVVVQNSPKLGISVEGLASLKPVLAAELMPVRAHIPETITGCPPLYRREDVVRCKCGWEGREGLLGTIDRHRHSQQTCPACGHKQGLQLSRAFERLTDRFEIVELETGTVAKVAPTQEQVPPSPEQ